MKGITAHLLGALALALVGGACLTVGMLEREMARAAQHIVAMNYEDQEAAFENAERYFEYASHLPWVGNEPLNDVRAHKAAVYYWRRDFGTLVPQQTDPVAAVAADNLDLQLVVANAVFRAGQARAKDRQTAFQALDAGMNAYLTVLKNAPRHEEAAYNYEYLARLRGDVEGGRRRPVLATAEESSPLGEGGNPLGDTKMEDFKIYIPFTSEERTKAGDPGKAAPRPRKG